MRLGLGGAAIGEDLARIADSPVDGAQQGRGETLDHGIIHVGQAVGDQLCRRQNIAHVVVDLRHGKAKLGKALLLLQRLLQLALHAGEMLAGDGKLISPLRRHEHPTRIGRIVREFLHARRHPPDRRDQHAVDGEEDQRRRDQRNDK
ncbi:hypothetical protein D9M70_504660 [compost metagenome]